MIASLVLSFTQLSHHQRAQVGGPATTISTALTKDELFWPSLGKSPSTIWPSSCRWGSWARSLLAMLLNQRVRGESVFRTLFYLPTLTPVAAAALLWAWLLHAEVGLVNYILSLVGHQRPALVRLGQRGPCRRSS